jgi:hypothetical protein
VAATTSSKNVGALGSAGAVSVIETSELLICIKKTEVLGYLMENNSGIRGQLIGVEGWLLRLVSMLR